MNSPKPAITPAPSPQSQALSATLTRLESLLDEERAELSGGRFSRVPEFNMRKSQLLLELSRTVKAAAAISAGPDMEERVSALRRKLIDNRAVLGVHLEAAREVVAIITQAMQDAESDGTYTRVIPFAGWQRK